ncbi:DNA-primase RepB domain-containing protein [Alicyclobacillus acidocaldarius]|uniref:DNA-primase RepB domain-containing protein n=1 Tax=Alicyclobacillus acidocaldarius TaxID=405212 RepID=UPI001C54C22B|nr:DNA-primase RepB domain-containing protein [Alicyclobacillus acidocaldarius]
MARTFLRKLVAAQLPLAGDGALYFELAFRDETQKNAVLKASMARVAGGDSPEGVADTLARMIPSNKAAYIGIVPRRKYSPKHVTKDQVHTRTRVLWLDIDDFSGSWQDFAEKLPASPNWVTHSGHGLHLYFHLDKPVFIEQAESIMRELAERIGADHTFDRARVLRIPGTWNRKSEPPVLATLEEVDDTPRPAEAFLALSPEGHIPSSSKQDVQLSGRDVSDAEVERAVARLPRRIRVLLRTGEDPSPEARQDPSRSADQFTAIRAMVACGFDPDLIIAIFTNPDFALSARTLEREKWRKGSGVQSVLADIRRAKERMCEEEAELVQRFPRVGKIRAVLSFFEGDSKHAVPAALKSRWLREFADSTIRELQDCARVIVDERESLGTSEADKFRVRQLGRMQQTLDDLTEQVLFLLPFSDLVTRDPAIFAPGSRLHKEMNSHAWWKRAVRRKEALNYYQHARFESVGRFTQELLAIHDDLGRHIDRGSYRWRNFVVQAAFQTISEQGKFVCANLPDADAKLYNTSGVYYRMASGDVIPVESGDFDTFLSTTLRIPDQSLRGSVVDEISTHRHVFDRVYVGFVSGFNKQEGAIYIDCGRNKLLRVAADAPPQEVENGAGSILLRSYLRPWKYTSNRPQGLLDRLVRSMAVDTSDGQPEEYTKQAAKMWLVANFLRGLVPVYPILSIEGPPGSGKTTLAHLLLACIRGCAEDPTQNMPNDDRSFFATLANSGVLAFDNAEYIPSKGILDILARVYQRGTFKQRRLYRNDEEVTVNSDAFVALTAINPPWGRADIASRCLNLPLRRWHDAKNGERERASSLLAWTLQHRNEILSEIADSIQKLLQFLAERSWDPVHVPIEHRMGDFVDLMSTWAIANAEGKDQARMLEWYTAMWKAILSRQSKFILDETGLVDLLMKYLERHKQNGPRFKKTTSDWYRALENAFGDEFSAICKTAQELGRKFRDLRDILSQIGITLRQAGGRRGSSQWEIDISGWVEDTNSQ